MTKIAIVVCSNAALDYLDHPADITIFRSKIHFNEEMFDDFTELSAETFYDRIKREPNVIPKTSYVSIGFMLDTFERLTNEGYTDAIIITIARALSGLHDAILNLKSQTKLKLHVFDSKTLAYPESLMALTAHKLANQQMDVEGILDQLKKIRDHQKMYFAVDTLLYLVKNGRLSKIQGTLGTFFKIKPVLTLNQDGKVIFLEKIRTTHRALQRIVELYLNETKDLEVETFISHANNDEAVQYIQSKIHEVYPDRLINTAYLTPVVGAHCGPKAIGLGYIVKK